MNLTNKPDNDDDVTTTKENTTKVGATQVLSFNSLILKECNFTEAQWFDVRLLLSCRFSPKIKRIRLWDCNLSLPKKSKSHLSKQVDLFDTCMAQFFKTLEDKSCLVELDL